MNKWLGMVAAGCALWLTGCYQPREGCLDPLATNYDVAADEPCLECCTWPELSVQVLHRYAPPAQPDALLPLKYEQPLQVWPDTMHPFMLKRFRFWMSHVQLLGIGGELFGVLERLPVALPDGQLVELEDNYAVADRDIFSSFIVGTIQADGYLKGIRLQVGLDSLERALLPESLPEGHVLRTYADSILFDVQAGYLSGRAWVYPDTTTTDWLDVAWVQPVGVTLWLDQPVFLPKGSGVKVILVINYTQLFEGIDFAATDPDQLRFNIVSALSNAISIDTLLVK